jgi:hypothetical protein
MHPIESGTYSIGKIKSFQWRVVRIALEIKSIPLRVEHIAPGDQDHPMDSGAYSIVKIKFIP